MQVAIGSLVYNAQVLLETDYNVAKNIIYIGGKCIPWLCKNKMPLRPQMLQFLSENDSPEGDNSENDSSENEES